MSGRKSPHQILCSDAVWSTYQRMAEDQEKGVDELITDALVAYAQLAGYQTGVAGEPDDDEGPATPPPTRTRESTSRPLPPPPPPMPPAGARFGRPAIPSPAAFPTVAGHSTASAPNGADGTPAGQSAPPLYLVFDNQKYRIDKDQFIIGRGSKSSDLPIKDGNISRKHAAVIRRNGTYFIKDLGSTNGIDYKGMRIDNKRIDEGDLFHLCDYELRFTYKR
ncbi:MAG TPA: FHA domain-containing protein [Polyangia bacterium]|nr:FHA domain-containing protein [Polyangia bacterium]